MSVSIKGNVLHAWATVEFQVLLDLRLSSSWRGFVDGELNTPTAILHDLRHERGIFCADGSIIEVDELCKAEHTLIESDPLVHFAQFDIAHNVVDGGQARRSSTARNIRAQRLEPWHEDAPL